jgi:hypothetical protein
MTMRTIFKTTTMVGTLGVLAACQPAIPDSGFGAPGRGVGFDTSAQARAQLDQPSAVQAQTLPSSNAQNQAAQLANQPAPRPVQVPAQTSQQQVAVQVPAPQTLPPAAASTQVVQQQVPHGVSTGPRTSVIDGRSVLNASPSNPAPVAANNPGISDENDFDAVAERQSIESDKARIAANRAQYAVIQPTALPTRSESSQPNVVAYALQTKHPRGTQVHRRRGFASAAKTERNCAVYSTADEAQIDFLARGGPSRDRLALDPDGDGYACAWNPAKYRG